jgi:hypothetical protein
MMHLNGRHEMSPEKCLKDYCEFQRENREAVRLPLYGLEHAAQGFREIESRGKAMNA